MSRYHEEELLGKSYDRHLAARLIRYLQPYRWLIATSVLMLLLISGLRLVGPYLTKIVIDQHITPGNLEGLPNIVTLFFIAMFFQLVISVGQTYLMNWTGQKIMYDLRLQIFSHIQKLDQSYFDRNPVGRIITRITTDVDVLNELFTAGVVSIFGDIFALSGIVIVMLWLDWKLALVSFSVIPLIFIATTIFKVKARGSYRWVRICIARINAFLQENITGMSTVQIFAQEPRKFREFDERNEEHLQANLQSILYYAVFYPVINLLGALAISLILWRGGIQVLDQALTLGALVAFIQYSENFYKPISDLSEKFNILQSAMASSERIFKLLDTKPRIVSPTKPFMLEKISGGIEFRDVSFSYRSGVPVLEEINLLVRPGEKVAIVGATGSGKSTFINLLCRFYEAEKGAIFFDGINIKNLELNVLRRSIAVVSQDVFIFQGTIRDNVRLWRKPISSAEVEKATKLVHAHRFIKNLPTGISTQLAERGAGLSGGQRQLLAFARALAHDPKILVLDEATSSVDTETELLIQDALNQLMKDRTSLIIAHRLSTIQNCDRIVVFHKGKIHEMGTHQNLLRKRGIYHKLYKLQYKDQLTTPKNPTNVVEP